MQWSALKTRVKSFIASDVRKRIDFHVTSYRRSHDEAEKAWLTIDGKIVLSQAGTDTNGREPCIPAKALWREMAVTIQCTIQISRISRSQKSWSGTALSNLATLSEGI
jgi:hypothetical protein